MKRIHPLAIGPFVVALGACSSGSGSHQAQPTRDGPDGAAASRDGGAAGDDSSTGGGDDGGASATEYDATLVGAQVAPTAVTTSASGTGKFMLQPDMQTLTYDITQNVANAMSVSLHIGAVGEVGDVTHALTPVSGHMTGKVTLTTDEQAAIALDQIYVDVESAANPNGEIRGQLTPPGAEIFVAHPTGQQEVPPVASAYTAHAGFVMTWDPTSSTGSLVYHIVTSAVPTNVYLQRSIGATTGPTVYSLQNVSGTMDGTLSLTNQSDHADLEQGRYCVNIATAANGAGELRGQILPPAATLFTGVLSGANEVPPNGSMAGGGAQFVLSADHTQLSYEAVVTGTIPTGAEIDNAPPGMTGPTMYRLTLGGQGALGSLGVTASDVQKLMSNAVYTNVRTAGYVNGELRANLVVQK
jgi:hypothetical protein